MNRDSKPADAGFLSRWSRRKIEARDPSPRAAEALPEKRPVADEAPTLPPVDELTLDSDFRGFFHPKVDEGVRRAALRKLFSDPHFNVMDGLDVYIDDYSKTEPIPAEMLAGLRQAQRILDWAEGKDDPPADAPEEADVAMAESEEAPTLMSEVAPAPEAPRSEAAETIPAATAGNAVTAR